MKPQLATAMTDTHQSEVAGTSTPSTQVWTSPFRCRLFQSKLSFADQKTVTQVWDYPKRRAPEHLGIEEHAEQICTLTGNSKEEVEEQVDHVLSELGHPLTGSWNHRGML